MTVNDTLKEISMKKIDSLIESANEAAKRVRQVFVFTLVACVVIFIAAFNTYFSWMRHVNAQERADYPVKHGFLLTPDEETSAPYEGNLSNAGSYSRVESGTGKLEDKLVSLNGELVSHSYRKLIDTYFERQSVNIPILGLKVSTHDLPILASLCILVFLVWLYFANRRESRIIKEIALEHSLPPSWTTTPDDQLRYKLKDYILQGTIHKFIFISANGYNEEDSPREKHRKVGVGMVERVTLRVLHYVPVIALGVLFLGEIVSVTFRTNYKLEDLPGSLKPLSLITDYPIEQGLRYGCMLIVLYLSYRIIRDTRAHSKASESAFALMQLENKALALALANNQRTSKLEPEIQPGTAGTSSDQAAR